MGYSILFSYYKVIGEEERLIDEYLLPYTDTKEGLKSILMKQNYQFIDHDLWGVHIHNFMSIAEIVEA